MRLWAVERGPLHKMKLPLKPIACGNLLLVQKVSRMSIGTELLSSYVEIGGGISKNAEYRLTISSSHLDIHTCHAQPPCAKGLAHPL